NRERVVLKKASRGVIYDRNGTLLVENEPSYSVVVSPPDLAGFNCVTRQFVTNTVFVDLAKIVGATNIVAVLPNELPVEKEGEIANRLSVLLNVQADTLRGPLKQIMDANGASQNLFVLRKDLGDDVAQKVSADLKYLPG